MTRCVSLHFTSSPASVLLSGLLACLAAIGCRSESEGLPDLPPQDTPGLHDDHGHDHAHDHAELGPHGGHIVVLDPGHHHAEWVHLDEENLVEVYLGELAESAKQVRLVAEMPGKDPTTYELEPATEALGAGGYQIKSPNLLTHIQMSDGSTIRVTLVVETEHGTVRSSLGGDHDHDH